ncbi:MAG: hypothetical protein M3X11_01860 [Acidobacteriota bacterium]|nr:hypothetical protein [Acidobacteriota bacterium]
MNRSNDNQAEREMVAYLLGEMTDDEQTQFEMRYLADDTLFDQMLLVKQELIDAYVRDHLDAEAREKFERHFLATPEAQKEVAFAHALREKLNEPAREAPAKAQRSRWLGWLDSWSVGEIGLAAAALLLVMIGSGWLLVQNRKLRHELSALHAERVNQLRRQEELQQQLAQLLAPTPAPIVPLPPERLAQNDDLVAINLLPAARDAANTQVVNLPTGARAPRLNLQLNFQPVALRCHVTLQTPDGAKLERRNLRARPLPQGGFSVQADFPATPLKPGNYEVTVAGRDADDNNQQVTIPYHFRVEISGRR